MNGSSTPTAPAFTNGVCETKTSTSSGQSSVVRTSDMRLWSVGNCVGPTLTAFAWNSRRIPRSPKNPTMLLTAWSKPGMARSAWSAARSAGCSQETGAISVKTVLGRAVGMPVASVMGPSRENGAAEVAAAVASPYARR
jgi:hypothetical protein